MKSFASTRLSRDEFLDWLGGGELTNANEAPMALPGDEDQFVTLIWDERSDQSLSQPLVAVPMQGMNDFFAFTSTYVATYRPYSAFYRVIPLELAEHIELRREPSASMLGRCAKLVAGGALAEHYLKSRGRTASFGSSLTSANATLSASLGAAILSGYSSEVIPWLANQWSSIHVGEKYSDDPSVALEIVPIWRRLAMVLRGEIDLADHRDDIPAKAVSAFILAALETGINAELLGMLSPSLTRNEDPLRALLASREERIRSFNRFVSGMAESASEGFENSFMAGLLLAIAGNGSFEMLRSAKELAERSPAAIVWFGICAALFDESNVLTTSNCLGRRIVRDLSAPDKLFDSPGADLSAFEYFALSRNRDALELASSISMDAFCVELLPDVVTYVPRLLRNREARSWDDNQILADSLAEIKHVIERTQRRLNRSTEPRQQELFRSEKKPRGRSIY